MRTGPNLGTHIGRSVPMSPNRTSDPSASRANFFPGILEGLVGRLGLPPPGVTDPPTSVREGVACHWAAALKETIRRMEGRDINLRQVTSTMVPHGLHLDYDLDF